jgi:hypothetical protein
VHYPYNLSKKVIALLYIPWIISELVSYHPVLSYFVAWLGSFFVFYLTIVSPFSYFSSDLPKSQQAMRPIVLIQLTFAGFMCCTSIFYFFDHLGYEYLTDISAQTFQAGEQTARIAKCQRLALLGHIALTTGILSMTKYFPPVKYGVAAAQIPLLIKICILTNLAASSLTMTPELLQFKQPLLNIALSCSAYLFILGITRKHRFCILFGITTFGLNIIPAILTGFKEAVILNVILIAFLAYPYFKRTVLVLAVPGIYILLYVLPTFTVVIRNQLWVQKKTREQAGTKAYQTFFEEHNEHEITGNNWEFLTNRFSEIGMFTTYIKQVPSQYPYYGLQIIENSIIALVPRALWHEKPNTEHLAMERVYKAGVANRASSVSAKTRPVVDAYLTAGPVGVFIAMLIYGILTQIICNKAEQLFGGYELGCIVIFNSQFQPLWRGNTFEFLINNILYSYILMMIIHWILKKTKVLIPLY